jgi:hypothetical protein
MKRNLLVCIAILALAVTAGAQMPYNQKKAAQRAAANPGYRGTSAVRQMAPQRTFPSARRQPAFSNAQFRQPMPRTAPIRPRMNNSFVNRPITANTAAWRRTHLPSNDWAGNRFDARPRPSGAFVNRSAVGDIEARRQTRLANTADSRDSRFTTRPRPSSSVLNRFTMNDIASRRQTRAELNNRWADSTFRRQARDSFVNGSRNASFWSERHAAFSDNWRGEAFAGRQYWPFRNYQRQWHDSGWWHHHCDRIVFVTVYSQPFPFYFDAGYWYPAWGYYPDSYYPYDGPIYGYNDLPPDEVVTNVQTQLYYEGYYDGPIDGILGPDTRAAIADYQADHGLAVTAAIDEPTVESLGLV